MKVINIILSDMCSSTMTTGRDNLFGKCNGYDANCRGFNVNLDKFENCMTFIGGFVDSHFFVKSEIDKLYQNCFGHNQH